MSIQCEWPEKAWKHIDCDQAGIDADSLMSIEERIRVRMKGVYRFLMIKNGCVVYNGCYQGVQEGDVLPVFSITKSIVSALIGIAIKQGLLLSETSMLYAQFPETLIPASQGHKKLLTLKHLLTMTSGFYFPPHYGMSDRVSSSGDEINTILCLPVRRKYIGRFAYNDANYHLLSAIIGKVSGLDTHTFACRNLFEPIGITGTAGNLLWETNSSGIHYGGFGLHMCAEDMARIGHLYNNFGSWKGCSVIERDWVELSWQHHADDGKGQEYGYGWWRTEIQGVPMIFAQGAGGQHIACFPEQNAVAVVQTKPESAVYLEFPDFWNAIVQMLKN